MISRPPLPELLRRTQKDLASRLEGDPFLQRSFEAALAKVLAGLTHGLYGHQEHIGRQAVPNPDADELSILAWAQLFLDVPRKMATRATGQATFDGAEGATIPAGSQVQVGDALYEVTADGVVAGGNVAVSIKAVHAGASGNASEGARAQLTMPIAGIDTVGAVGPGDIVGGTDDETIESVFERLRQRLTRPSRGGGPGDFRAWVMETPGVSVKDAWEYRWRNGIGTVGVSFTVNAGGVDGGPVPTPEQRQLVHDYVMTQAPMAMRELVVVPLVGKPLVAHVLIAPFDAEARAHIRGSLAELLASAVPEQPVLHSHILAAIANTPGLADWDLDMPTADVPAGEAEIIIYDADSITFSEKI